MIKQLRPKHTIALTAVAALAFTACSGSSESEITSAPTTQAPNDTSATIPDAAPATTDDSGANAPPQSEPTATDDSDLADEDLEDDDSVDGDMDDDAADEGAVDVDGLFGDAFLPENVDDSPFCQSYASVFKGLIGISFTAAFTEMGEAEESENVSESFELLIYPGIAEDIEVVIASAPPALSPFFDPLSERIDAAVEALRGAGFTDAEIAEIAAADTDGAAEAVDVDEFEPRLSVAAAALIESSGPFLAFIETMDVPTEDAVEAEADAFLDAECPLLAATLDNL